MADAQEQRKLKPIYDALDTGSYKLAIQLCNKSLKKQPNHEVVRALKSLALFRANKLEESVTLCNEILSSKPTDETVLGIMAHVLKHIDRSPEIVGMFEEAFKKQPQSEELGAQAFMAMIRAGGFKNAQNTSFKMYNRFKEPKYLFWSIMAAVLQAQNSSSTDESVQHAPILLNLALRLMVTSPVPSHVTPDHFHLHLTILKSLNMLKDAYELVVSPHGVKLCQMSLVVDELRREIFDAHGVHKEEALICRDRLESGDRNWTTFLSLINSIFKHIAHLESNPTPSNASSTAPQQGESPKDSVTSDPEGTPKPVHRLDLDTSDPAALINGLRELFAHLVDKDGLSERGAHLALLQLERKVRTWKESKGEPISPDLFSSLCQYYNNFADKACCFEDLKPCVADLKTTPISSDKSSELDQWLTFLRDQESKKDLTSTKSLQRLINALKLIRYSSTHVQTEEEERQDAEKYLKFYFEALPLGKDLADKELQPADDLSLLSANAFVSAWILSKKESYLHEALIALEYASQKSKHNYQFRILAIRLYRLIGANTPATEHYRMLDTKQIQTDTLSHLILSRASTYSLAAVGDLQMMTVCVNSSDIYTSNGTETADMITRAFQYEKYSQITEFVEFEDRLENSIQRDLTRYDYTRMRFTHEKLEHDVLALELQELEFVREKMHYDNRDYSVIPNYQPRGQQLTDQTSMGPVRGCQWLSLFLQLYIRAYSRASKTITSGSPELDDFRSSWLSELTEVEKRFVKFSQILHEWVPSPPLEPREPSLLGPVKTNGDTNGKAEPSAPKELDPFLKVEATPEAAVKFFADVLEELKTAINNGSLLWEIVHIAVVAQEAYLLLQAIAFPWLPTAGKAKKAEQAIVQSLKDTRSQAAAHMREIAQLLTTLAETDSTNERRDAIVGQSFAKLGAVDSQLDDEHVQGVVKTILDSRKMILDGVGRGILKIANGT